MLTRTLVLAAALSAPLPVLAQHAHHAPTAGAPAEAASPREPGQAAFAAIQEIVAILEADPNTDWTKVDVEALRRHLVDMDNVTLRAQVTAQSVEGGARFVVAGDDQVAASIRRMVLSHAATMDGVGGWRLQAEERTGGAALTVTAAKPADVDKIRGLGFIGVMTRGMHHQEHHLMLARGADPHR